MNALYNEIEPFAADWLDSLVAAGHIAPGRVERRSIVDLSPADVAGPGQRHFFAGIGGWSYALRLAGISDDANIWTGSCPCQPFSDAGKRSGTRDARHLWPTWFGLIRECRPAAVFGEQVASRAGLAWFDAVRADLEGCGYAVGASDLCAAGVGAPHIRQRLYFVAYAGGERLEGERLRVQPGESRQAGSEVGGAARLAEQLGNSCSSRGRRHAGGLPDAEAQGESEGREPRRVADEPVDAGGMGDADDADVWQRVEPRSRPGRKGAVDADRTGPSGEGMANTASLGRRARDIDLRTRQRESDVARRGAIDEHDGWRNVVWLPCLDGKARPVEPGLEPLAHGVSGRVVVRRAIEQADATIQEEHWYNRAGALAGFGNAIVPELAAAFIEAAEAARRSVK